VASGGHERGVPAVGHGAEVIGGLEARCYDLLGDLASYESELRDSLDSVHAWRDRVLVIMDENLDVADVSSTFEGLRKFLASRR
jgi:hypothetical protein